MITDKAFARASNIIEHEDEESKKRQQDVSTRRQNKMETSGGTSVPTKE
jgi:hypothetical protein